MKKSIFFLNVLSIIFIMFLFSCKKDQGLVSIIIQSEQHEVDAGNNEIFNFSVIGNDGVDYTKSSEIYINGSLISGQTYAPEDAETIEVYAVSRSCCKRLSVSKKNLPFFWHQ